MAGQEGHRERARATWAAGNWDGCARLVGPVGERVLERIALEPGMDVLDVGTGSGGNVAIPAALRGAKVVGLDVTPELFDSARRFAAAAGVEVEWIEGDAQDLPFADASFDRVLSTFGAMFAPDHGRAAAELVRVCRPGGLVGMTTWAREGFVGELFALSGKFLPPPPGAQTPPDWGVESHVREMFADADAHAAIAHETVVFEWPSVADAVRDYATDFGPFVMARRQLEPQNRWGDFLEEFTALVARFADTSAGSAHIDADYLLITVRR
jgi:ubiquinone/menaquinone biosynthesis C-methylase UbiE